MVVIWTDCCTYICPAACSSAAAHNPYAIRFIAIELDFLYTVIQNPSKQLIRRSCHAPPVLFRPCDGQSMGFCCLLKVLVVICPSSAAILYIDDFIIVLMTHFVQKGTDSVCPLCRKKVLCCDSFVTLQVGYGSTNDGTSLKARVCGTCLDRLYSRLHSLQKRKKVLNAESHKYTRDNQQVLRHC